MTSVHHKVQFPAHQEPMYTKTKSVQGICYQLQYEQEPAGCSTCTPSKIY